jgi:hypothetical protein
VKARLSRSLLMLYPRAWRERYSEELTDLSAELLAAGEVSRSRLALELTTAALAERAHSWNRTHTLAVLLGSVALIVVVAALLATNTLGLGGSTSARVTPVGWDSVTYRDAQVSFPPSFDTITAMGGAPSNLRFAPRRAPPVNLRFPPRRPSPVEEHVWRLCGARPSCASYRWARFLWPTPVSSPPSSTAWRSTTARKATSTRRPCT